VFNYLDLGSLLNARTVCRSWNSHVVTSLYERRSKLKIVFNNYHWRKTTTYGLERMVDFIEFVNETGKCPFETFKIGTSVLMEKGNDRHVMKFVTYCGDYIKELAVKDDWDGWALEKRAHNFAIPKFLHFQNLQKLSIHLGGDSGRDRLELFYRIIKGSPNLEHFRLRTTKRDDGEAVECLIHALKDSPRNLKTLDIFAQSKESHLLAIGAADLKLESLSLDLWRSRISNPNILKNFLHSQSKTLKSLKLSDEFRSFRCSIHFPCMEELTDLKINGSIYGRIALSFPLLSYSDKFPKLKTLSFSDLSVDWDIFFRTDMPPSLTVEELILPYSVLGYRDGPFLQKIAYLFPGLRRLEIPNYPSLLEVIFVIMNQLEELVIISSEVTPAVDLSFLPREMFKVEETICSDSDSMLKETRVKILRLSP